MEIKDNVVEECEDIKVVVAPKAKKRKVIHAYSSHDYDKEKEKMQKKTTFENDNDDTISESVKIK